jgi:hypothetical protein
MKYLTFLVLLLIASVSKAQIGINSTGSAPNNSAMLDVQSTTKGTLITRMNSAQRKAIVSPTVGLLVFDTDGSTLFLYDGQNWLPILLGGSSKDVPLVQRYAPDGLTNDNFGYSVAISGDYAVVGSPFHDIDGKNNQGAVYIFKKDNSTWTLNQKITATTGQEGDLFGYSVAIEGDYIIVGAINANSHGEAYSFHRESAGWVMIEKLIPINIQLGYNGGCSVAISGDYAVVGVKNYETKGAAYIYYKVGNNWNPIQRITASDGTDNDNFGNSVAISGDYIIAGAYNDDVSTETNQGSAYIFHKNINNIWIEEQKLIASNGDTNDNFGLSVSISNDYAVIGSPFFDNGTATNQGTVYVFHRIGVNWIQDLQILVADGKANEVFGYAVSIAGSNLLIGAFSGIATTSINQGLAYLYKKSGTTWNFMRKLYESTPEKNNYFGFNLSINGDSFLIAAPFNSSINSYQGAVSFGKTDY